MDATPYLPALRACCAPLGSQSSRARQAAESLSGLAGLFGPFLAPLLVAARSGPGSRRRQFGRVSVFWAFLSQVLARDASCRWALTRLQAEAAARGERRPDDSTSAYCQARVALSLPWLESLFTMLERWFSPRVSGQWLGRTVRIIDGTGFTMPDTPANRRRWDYPGGTKPGCGFPTGKLVGLFCLHSGRLLAFVQDTWKPHDLNLARRLLGALRKNEVLIADRAYCGWTFLALLRRRGVDFVIRLHQARLVPRRNGTTQESWPRPQRKQRETRSFWLNLPRELPVRLVRFVIEAPGYRSRPVVVATSLLDRKAFPDRAIAALYARRWQIELHYRQIKTNLGLDILRGLSPRTIEREIWMHAIAYNLIRALMLEAARSREVPVDRLSFKGAIDAVHAWSDLALGRKRHRAHARKELLARLAADRVPLRPHRHEPRSLKRRGKNYPLLTKPRAKTLMGALRHLTPCSPLGLS